jgi:hypothetical protein
MQCPTGSSIWFYLDSLVVEGGKSAFDALPPDVVAARRKAAEETSGGRPSAFPTQRIPNGSSAG